jgi:hypothetical protein
VTTLLDEMLARDVIIHDCRFGPSYLNPPQSVSGMPLNRPIDGHYKRVWYSEPDLTVGEVRLKGVGHREICESPVIIGG